MIDVWEIIRDGDNFFVIIEIKGENFFKMEKNFIKDEWIKFEKNKKVKVVM